MKGLWDALKEWEWWGVLWMVVAVGLATLEWRGSKGKKGG